MTEERNKRFSGKLPVLLAVALLAALGFAAWRGGFFAKVHSAQELREVIAGTGAWAGAVYFALQMTTVIIAPIPSNVMMLAGALALGFWPAMLLGISAVVLGSVISFLAARKLGRDAVQRLIDRGTMDKYLPIIEEKQEMFLFLTMLFPFFPDDAICILAGLTRIPFSHYLCIMILTRPWGLIFAALVGSGALTMPVWGWAVLGVAMMAVFFFAMKYSVRIEAWLLDRVQKILRREKR